MAQDLLIPKSTSIDESVAIVEWMVKDKHYIELGQSILVVETSKTNVELESEGTGYLLQCYKPENILKVGECFGKIFDTLNALENYLSTYQTNEIITDVSLPNFSNAALKYIKENSLNHSDFANLGLVTVEKIKSKLHTDKEIISPINKALFPDALVEQLSTSKLSAILNMKKGQESAIISSLTVQLDSQAIRTHLQTISWLNRRILPYILYVFSRMLKEYPRFTSYYSDKKLYLYNKINLGLAIDLGNGLKVVVIEEPEKLDLFDLQMSIIDCIAEYHENALPLSSLKTSTVTVTDLSQDNILSFQPVLNANQSVILGIGGDQDIQGCPLTLTIVFDHCVLSGQEVASFLKKFKERLLTEYLSLNLNNPTF